MNMNRAYSLVGVLAALLVLTTALLAVFRFNFLTEKAFYGDPAIRNNLRFLAWQAVRGEKTSMKLKPSDARSPTPTWSYGVQSEVPWLEISQEGQEFSIIPPPGPLPPDIRNQQPQKHDKE